MPLAVNVGAVATPNVLVMAVAVLVRGGERCPWPRWWRGGVRGEASTAPSTATDPAAAKAVPVFGLRRAGNHGEAAVGEKETRGEAGP